MHVSQYIRFWLNKLQAAVPKYWGDSPLMVSRTISSFTDRAVPVILLLSTEVRVVISVANEKGPECSPVGQGARQAHVLEKASYTSNWIKVQMPTLTFKSGWMKCISLETDSLLSRAKRNQKHKQQQQQLMFRCFYKHSLQRHNFPETGVSVRNRSGEEKSNSY